MPSKASLVEYYKHDVGDADAQFDHLETTLSHLLRVPHPALRGRTYGQALIDVLIERGAIPEGRVRVLEIGAGLGPLAGKIWRFGLMGYSCRADNVMLCLAALGSVLSDLGVAVHVGDAEAAAHAAYAAQHARAAQAKKKSHVRAA